MKELWGLPPHFGIYPIRLLKLGLPVHLRDTYTILYTLGWRAEYRTVQQSVQQLADLFSVIEGKSLQPRGMRKRLQELSQMGLVERSKRDGRWLTILKLRHGATMPSTGTTRVTWPGTSGTVGVPVSDPVGVPHLDKSIVAVDTDASVKQQQQDSRCDPDVERNEELLAEMGVLGGVRYRLATETWVTPDYLEAIRDYKAGELAKGNRLGPGWVVKFVGEGNEAPEVSGTPDRYRYVRGKYKDYIKH